MALTIQIGNKKFKVREPETTIGRDPSCSIILQEPSVSRRHAVICEEEDGYIISDLGSIEGVFVNGEKIEGKVKLYKGDSIGISTITGNIIAGPKRPLEQETASESGEGDEGFDERSGSIDEVTGTHQFQAGRLPAPGSKSKKKSRLKNPFYIVMILIVGLLFVFVMFLSQMSEGKKQEEMISQVDIAHEVAKYLEIPPQIFVEGLEKDQIRQQANELFNNAEARFQMLHVKYGQPYEAYQRYRKAQALLESIGEQPDYYDRLLHNMDKCRKTVEDRIVESMQEGWVASMQKRWVDGYDAYQRVLATIPEKDFPIAEEARKRMQQIAPKLPKRR